MAATDALATRPGWMRRLLGRRGARLALLSLWFVAASAIFAPFLASDRPLALDAIDVRAYEGSRAELEPLVREWHARLLEAADAERGVRLSDPETVHQAFVARETLARQLRAVELRLATLRRFAPVQREIQSALDGFEHRARGWTQKVSEGAVDDLGPAESLVEGSAALALALRAEPGRFELRSRRSFPLLASLTLLDWWLALATAGASVLLVARAGARRQLLWLGAALVIAWLARAGFRAPAGLATQEVKEALASREIVPASVVFAPVPFGRDETNLTEALRPPTWLPSAELRPEGGYVRGPRAARTDPASGLEQASWPVRVLPGEPELNGLLRHPLGTDALGRDVLARVLWGGRASLAVALAVVAVVLLVGTLMGALAGYLRGAFDDAVNALIAVLQAFPPFFLILTAVAIGAEGPAGGALPPLAWVVLVIALVGWTGVARLVRAEALRVRELDYVLAARAMGFSHARLLLRHVLPNVLAPALVAAGFVAVSAILAESSVSYLGFGVRVPTPSWGALMQEARSAAHAWLFVFPGLCVFVTCIALCWLGDAARDALDPREVP